MRAFKDKNIQNKQEGQQNLSEYVTILADKLQFFFDTPKAVWLQHF